MKEYFLQTKDLLLGLQPTPAGYENRGFAVWAKNMMATPSSIESASWPSLIAPAASPVWPWANLFACDNGWVLTGQDHLWSDFAPELNFTDSGATSRWTLGEVGQCLVVTAPGMSDIWILDPASNTWKNGANETPDLRYPHNVGCVSDFWGQCFLYGNVRDPSLGFDASFGRSIFAWSKPMSPALGREEYEEVVDDITVQAEGLDKRNNGGWLWVTDVGEILDIHTIGKDVAVFGSEGVAVLTRWREPGYGQQTISRVGIASAGAVAGPQGECWYVDLKGDLWHLGPKGAQLLYYSSYLSQLTDPCLTYHEANNELYISGAEDHFRYRPDLTAMTGPNDGDLLVAEIGSLVGFSDSLAGVVPTDVHWVSGIYNMARSGFKTLTWIQPFGDYPADAQVTTDYRYDMNAEFTSRPYINLHPHLSVHSGVTAPEFRISIKAESTGMRMTDLQARWQPTDKRFHRGKSASV